MARSRASWLVLAALWPSIARAQPSAMHSEMDALARERTQLQRTLTLSKVGTAGSVGVLVLGGLASYKTAKMCDAYPDPADDCELFQELATMGSVMLVGLGAGLTAAAVIVWVSTERKLDIVNQQLRPTLRVHGDGAVIGLDLRF